MKNDMIYNEQENTENEELISLVEELLMKSASLPRSLTPETILELKEFNRYVNSYYSIDIDYEGTDPFIMDKYNKEGFSKNTKESRLQLRSLKYIEQQKRIEEHFHGCSEIHIPEKLLYEIYDNLYDSSVSKDLIGFRSIEHKTEAKKVIYALQAYYFITAMNFKSKKYRIVARLFLDGILSTIEGYGLWNISRGLYAHSTEFENYLDMNDDNQNGEAWHLGGLSEENSKRYIKFMLNVALEQVNYTKEQLAINKIYKNIQRYIHLSKEGFFDHDPLPGYSELLFKELLLLGEINRGDVAEVIKMGKRTATDLVSDLIKMRLIKSDTIRGRKIRLMFNMHFISYLFPHIIR